jgi:hypothetical protein
MAAGTNLVAVVTGNRRITRRCGRADEIPIRANPASRTEKQKGIDQMPFLLFGYFGRAI